MQVPMKFSPTASGGVSPYIFLFSYGDGIQDAAGTHTYAAAGSYTVSVSAVDSKGQVGQGTCTATVGTTPLPPTPGPTPAGAGTISWTVGGQTSQYELFPVGSRDALKKLQDLIGTK
jgi:PKD repeat protein